MGTTLLRSRRSFFAQLHDYAPGRTAGALTLLLLQGATEGVGLLLLVPFLELVQQGEPGTGRSAAAAVAAGAFERVGLPMTMPVVLLVFVGLVALRSLLVLCSEMLLVRITAGYVDHLRTSLFTSIGNASWAHLARKRLADATYGIGQDIFRVGTGVRASLDLVAAILLVLVYSAVALALSPRTTAAALLIGAVLELIRIPILRRARELGQAMTEVNRTAFAAVVEFAQGLKLFKARGLGAEQRAKFVAAMAEIRERRLRFVQSQQLAHLLYQVMLAAALAALVYLATRIALPSAELLVLVFVFAKLMPMVSRVHQQGQAVVHALPAHQAAMEMLADYDAHAEPAAGAAGPPVRLEQGIRLEGVSVRYPGERRLALERVDCEIPAREVVGIVGPSGAGKTTLADLLIGLLTPLEGSVSVDGAPLSGDRLSAWRRGVAYLPQETFLLHDTIRANLLWMTPEASEEEIWDALRRVAADGFIRRLERGLDTLVGDRGTKLSGGERQRIALARALLCGPELLVLDEATSQIDADTEAVVARAIEELRGRVTVVIVAHRASILELADRLVLLEQGRVVDQGTPDEISARPGGALHRWMAVHGGLSAKAVDASAGA